MIRRRRAEGSIYIGKCQDTKRWSSLPHHIPPPLRTLSPNVLYYRRIAKQKNSKSRIEKGKHIPKRTQVTLSSTLQNYSTAPFHCPQIRSNLPTSSNQDSSKLEIITAAVTAVIAMVVETVIKADTQRSKIKQNSQRQNTRQKNSVTVSKQQDIGQQNF